MYTGDVPRNLWGQPGSGSNNNKLMACSCESEHLQLVSSSGTTKTSIKTFCLECLWLSSPWLNSQLTCRVCDFLPKKYFHNSHNINHNLDHLISAPTTFHPLCKFHLPCNLSSALQFLTHPKIVPPTLHPAIFHPPRNFFNLQHLQFFSTSRTPQFYQPPAPRNFFNLLYPLTFSTSRTRNFFNFPHPAIFSTSCTPQFFNLPHPAVFQPPAPRSFFNLPHPAIFSTSRTPQFFNLPHPAIFSTSRTPQSSHPAPRILVTPHPAN